MQSLISQSSQKNHMSYCKALKNFSKEKLDIHKHYHDKQYGFPIDDDNEIFARLMFEINQAGLSWEIILKKEKNFRQAFDGFDVKKVANYSQKDVNRLLKNEGIIRNRLKINAAIENAKAIISLQKEFNSFAKWIEFHHPKSINEWTKLFKKNFKFVGGEILNEFLMSIGVLENAHDKDCPIYKEIAKSQPLWMKK